MANSGKVEPTHVKQVETSKLFTSYLKQETLQIMNQAPELHKHTSYIHRRNFKMTVQMFCQE